MQDKVINQMVIAVVSSDQVGELAQQLVHNDFRFTRIDSSSGLLEEATACLMIGLDAARLDTLLKLFDVACQRRRKYIPASGEITQFQGQPLMIEAETGGAIIYTLDIERFVQF